LRVALLEGKFWPHRKALRLALDAIEPETLGGKNVSEKVPWARRCAGTFS
jgi:hypothetical protein